ncbi:hypothetical protein HC891_00930, partial [Candidatus Gracilibacteria bacterium]|nr:hypothetical protein [Candidatus Gracilibacteria bacterium]
MPRSILPSLLFIIAIVLSFSAGLTIPANAQSKIVGDGTAASCTAAALATQLEGGGSISFNCGSTPVTIVVSSPFDITAPQTSIDGADLITLEGANSRIFEHRTFGFIGSSELTLRNLTITKGRARGTSDSQDTAYEANGAAIRSRFQAASPDFKPTLNIVNVRFIDNDSTLEGVPSGREAYDYGGGAIYSQGGFVTISASEFRDNDANNGSGGAIHILQSGLTIADSSFENSTAIGARPQDSLGGAIYIDGLGGAEGLFAVSGSVFRNNRSYNAGGAVYVNMYEDSSSTQISTSSFEENAVIGGERAQGGAI